MICAGQGIRQGTILLTDPFTARRRMWTMTSFSRGDVVRVGLGMAAKARPSEMRLLTRYMTSSGP